MNVDFNSYFLVSVVDEGVHTSIHISSLLRYMNMNTKGFQKKTLPFIAKVMISGTFEARIFHLLDQLTVHDH